MKEDRWLKQMTRRPTTPGDAVADLLECRGMSQGELARRIGVSRATVSRLVNGKQVLTPDLALRLGRFFGDGPRIWLALQQQIDEWELLHADQTSYQSIEPLQKAA
jgi:addiction module HigA family antidote